MSEYTNHILQLLTTHFDHLTISPQSIRQYQRDKGNSCKPNRSSLGFRLFDVFLRTWHLGLTSFGGPPVHYTIIHRKFVEDEDDYAPWVDERTVSIGTLSLKNTSLTYCQYQDVFALSQALPGPASTKMVFIMVYLRAGLLPAIMAFFLWRSESVLP
jgi:chromate transport protein ChrA